MRGSAIEIGVRSDGTDISRRGMVRSVIGAAIAAVGVVLLPGAGQSVSAKRKGSRRNTRRKKNPKTTPTPTTTPQAICQPGELIGVVAVPATFFTVFTPVLKAGQRYVLRASGFWGSNATNGMDAFADFALATPQTPNLTFNGVRLGLAVNDGSPDFWGSYNPDHIYEKVVTGQGAAIGLRCNDANYNDNTGQLRVEVRCA